MTCQHEDHEDCMICRLCGECDESLDDDDVCDGCRENDNPEEDDEPDGDPNTLNCAHDWVYTGTAYGGDDERYHGEGRSYCSKCGADGDG